LHMVCTPTAETLPSDPELKRVIDAWPDLPAHVRAAVLAIVATAGKERICRPGRQQRVSGADSERLTTAGKSALCRSQDRA
jgi:hypothetical protein